MRAQTDRDHEVPSGGEGLIDTRSTWQLPGCSRWSLIQKHMGDTITQGSAASCVFCKTGGSAFSSRSWQPVLPWITFRNEKAKDAWMSMKQATNNGVVFIWHDGLQRSTERTKGGILSTGRRERRLKALAQPRIPSPTSVLLHLWALDQRCVDGNERVMVIRPTWELPRCTRNGVFSQKYMGDTITQGSNANL